MTHPTESDLDEVCQIRVEDFQRHLVKCTQCTNAEPVMPLYDESDIPEGLCSTGSRLANRASIAEKAYEDARDTTEDAANY